jgi:hypothetical protein
MNCLETRKSFPSFWQNALDGSQRLEFLDHLAGCANCDHAFRLFALTAPVLYGDYGARSRLQPQSAVTPRISSQFSARYAMNRWWAAGLALSMGAAAAIALYLAQPPQVTLADAFQDAVVDSDPNIQRASFSASDNPFGFQDTDSPMAPDLNQLSSNQRSQDDFGR